MHQRGPCEDHSAGYAISPARCHSTVPSHLQPHRPATPAGCPPRLVPGPADDDDSLSGHSGRSVYPSPITQSHPRLAGSEGGEPLPVTIYPQPPASERLARKCLVTRSLSRAHPIPQLRNHLPPCASPMEPYASKPAHDGPISRGKTRLQGLWYWHATCNIARQCTGRRDGLEGRQTEWLQLRSLPASVELKRRPAITGSWQCARPTVSGSPPGTGTSL